MNLKADAFNPLETQKSSQQIYHENAHGKLNKQYILQQQQFECPTWLVPHLMLNAGEHQSHKNIRYFPKNCHSKVFMHFLTVTPTHQHSWKVPNPSSSHRFICFQDFVNIKTQVKYLKMSKFLGVMLVVKFICEQ